MKFFHVYNEQYFEGLIKNGLINADTGFKIQHAFTVPDALKFNRFAAKGSRLYKLLKEGNHPFYVDRLAGGITYHEYDFDHSLIADYEQMLGKWFLGFQLHESASNRRHDWNLMMGYMQGQKGPYDAAQLRASSLREYAKLADGTLLPGLSQGTPEEYAPMRYAETPRAFDREVEEMFRIRMKQMDGLILPCDSFFLYTGMQNRLGMRTFMPEVGCQIPQMRIELALARGIARQSGKMWGAYYETWIGNLEEGYSMPCFNREPGNEWYLSQEEHPDDFTSNGANGGSSRLLQRRIYYYALMSGADYFSEEWGLNSSYSDMHTFALSPYGEVKKEFIADTQRLRGMNAQTPFALVLPKDYQCIELPDVYDAWEIGAHRDRYMHCILSREEKARYGHIEDVLKLIWTRNGRICGNESHVMTNSRFGDLFDIIYEDAPVQTLAGYAYLIDASPDGAFASRVGAEHRVLKSEDLGALEHRLHELERELLPCVVDGLHWLLSEDASANRYVSVFHNEGNYRSVKHGDVVDHGEDATVTVTFQQATVPHVVKESGGVRLSAVDECTYRLHVPATGFAILRY